MVAGIHSRGEDLAFFPPRRFFSKTCIYICSENAATCKELGDNVCVLCNYVDNLAIISCTALHLCIKTHESQTCLTLAKNSSIMEKFLTSFGAKYGVTFRENKA